MNKEQFINSKIKDIEGKIKGLEEGKKGAKSKLLNALAVVLLVFGGLGLFTGIGIQLGCLLVGGTLAISNKHAKKIAEQMIKELKEQLAHLNKVKTQGLKSTRDLNIKRVKKAQALNNEKAKIEQSVNNIKGINKATRIAAGVGLGLSFLVPSFFVISTIGLLGEAIISPIKTKKEKEIINLDKRISNISNDLSIIRIAGAQASGRRTPPPLPQQPQRNTNVRTRTITPEQEQQVNAYVESLVNQPTVDLPKRNVKK